MVWKLCSFGVAELCRILRNWHITDFVQRHCGCDGHAVMRNGFVDGEVEPVLDRLLHARICAYEERIRHAVNHRDALQDPRYLW